MDMSFGACGACSLRRAMAAGIPDLQQLTAPSGGANEVARGFGRKRGYREAVRNVNKELTSSVSENPHAGAASAQRHRTSLKMREDSPKRFLANAQWAVVS